MAHAFWKGSISFGLVDIPVSLRPLTSTDSLDFTLLDRTDFAPVGYQRYNKTTGKQVPWERVVRGYEYEDEQYVVLTDEELRSANVERSQTIAIEAFVDRAEIHPAFFETPYFVEPIRKDSRSYSLLRATLEESQLVGIATVVLRTRQHVAALVVRDHVMMLDLLRYAEDLRLPKGLEVPAQTGKAKPSEAELRVASRLVEEMRAKWKPDQYKDEYRHDVLELIQKKIKSGKVHEITKPKEPSARGRARSEIVDLMPLLKKSLAQRSESPKSERRSTTAKRSRTNGRAGAGTRARRHA